MVGFRRGTTVVVASVAALAVVASAQARPDATPQRVAVTMSEFAFVLKPKVVRKGTAVVFTTTNRGRVGHDFRIGGRKTPVVAAGKRATLRVTFRKAGRYRYVCTLPSHALAGMQGVLVVR